jgi:DNA polymerase I
MNRLLLIDAKNIMYRSYFTPELKDVENGGLIGYINIMRHAFRELRPTHIVTCGDSYKNFRKDNLETYKAHRKEAPDEFKRQLKYIPDICEALGLNYLEVYGFEADDIGATFAHLADLEENFAVYISSNDKDFLQCLTDSTKVVNFSQGGDVYYVTQEMMYNKYGVHHYQFVDYLSIVGDVADGYFGARKVGPKGACELLAEFDTLEGIFENVDKIKKKVYRESFINNEAEIRQSKELAQIIKTVPINKNVEDFRYKGIDREKYIEVFTKLEMWSMLEKIK